RDEKDAPTPQFLIPVAPFLERDLVLFCFEHVHDRFPVEMRFASVSAAFFPLDCGASRFPGHLAIRLEPPFTFSPTFTRISAPFGSQTSTREPNRTSPMRSRSEEHTSELQSLAYLVCRLLLEKKKTHPAAYIDGTTT